MYKIEHFKHPNKFNINENETTMRGSEVLEQVDDEILSQFLQKIEDRIGGKLIDIKRSQVYPRFGVYDGATINVEFKQAASEKDTIGFRFSVLLDVVECDVFNDVTAGYSALFTKMWREVLLNNFGEQVILYLKEEKERQHEALHDAYEEVINEYGKVFNDYETERKAVEEEFNIGGKQL